MPVDTGGLPVRSAHRKIRIVARPRLSGFLFTHAVEGLRGRVFLLVEELTARRGAFGPALFALDLCLELRVSTPRAFARILARELIDGHLEASFVKSSANAGAHARFHSTVGPLFPTHLPYI